MCARGSDGLLSQPVLGDLVAHPISPDTKQPGRLGLIAFGLLQCRRNQVLLVVIQ
jgi:hypothetical protein